MKRKQVDIYNDERINKNKKLEQGQKDVYNKWKKVQQKLKNSMLNIGC